MTHVLLFFLKQTSTYTLVKHRYTRHFRTSAKQATQNPPTLLTHLYHLYQTDCMVVKKKNLKMCKIYKKTLQKRLTPLLTRPYNRLKTMEKAAGAGVKYFREAQAFNQDSEALR